MNHNITKHTIDERFITDLFSHPSFQNKMGMFCQQKVNSINKMQSSLSISKNAQGQSINELVEDICNSLSQEYKQAIDRECLTIYQSNIHILKQIQKLKCNKYLGSPVKTDGSSAQKQKNIDMSILSQVSLELQNDPVKLKRSLEQMHNKLRETSFIASFQYESGGSKERQEFQEKMNFNLQNVSGEISKLETKIQQRLKNIEESINKKMENSYKTMTSVFETINDLQLKTGILRDKREEKKDILNKAIDSKLINHDNRNKDKSYTQKSIKNVEEQTNNTRRRSFLGFLKY